MEDLERIYVDLENLASDVDCVAFEGNVFSVGDGSSGAERTFASLESAYIRLVNAGWNDPPSSFSRFDILWSFDLLAF